VKKSQTDRHGETNIEMEIDGISSLHQSAYGRGHSTETALLKVINDLLLSADHGEVSALCLQDLLVAFETVDHQLLLARLRGRFGVAGNNAFFLQLSLSVVNQNQGLINC